MGYKVEFIPIRVTHIPGMGDVLVYDVKYGDGSCFQNGMISLDMKWMKPCTMGINNNKWCEIIANHLYDWHYMIKEPNTSLRQIEVGLVSLVRDIAFERLVLND